MGDLTNSFVGELCGGELNDASTTRTVVIIVIYPSFGDDASFGHVAGVLEGTEKFYQVILVSYPGKLFHS